MSSATVAAATASGDHAMGIYSPDTPPKGFSGPAYGRFRFPAEHVVKWNCVFRMHAAMGTIPTGDYTFHHDVGVGTLEDVRSTLVRLATAFLVRP